MFYSLVQTIVCVLLIQAGIYALHLNGPSANSNGASLGSVGGGGGGVNAPTSHGGSGAAQLNAAVNTNQMLNILSANQHAQHLHAGGSGSGSGGGGGGGGDIGRSRTLSNSAVNPLGNAGRLSQELADRAQLERERLMLLGLAKQTALASGGGTGHHGRPIITGRIQMSPVDDVESDYTSLLLPQTRGPLYGSVVKEPAAVEDDEYVDEEQREYDRARLASGAHRKYEYGRIVEPAEREEYAEPQPIDELDELIEAEPEMDDVLSDLESYQYLDELLPPEHRSLWGDDGLGYGIAGGNSRPHHLNDGFPLLLNPYRTLEELENSPSHTLQEIFEKESHDKAETKAHRQHALHPTREQQKQQQQYEQQQQQARHQQSTQPQQQYTFSGGVKHRNGGYGVDYNNNMQQKWQRKRSQQQQQQRQLQQWQRNIFGQQLKQQQLHHFGAQPQRHSKLSLANSEATATKHIPLNDSTNDLNNNNSNNKLSSALNALATQQQSSSAPIITSGDAAMKSDQLQQQQRQQQQQQEPDEPRQVGKVSTADDASPATGLSKAAAKLKAQQQQQQQQHKKQQTPSQKQDSFLHPNHKRSGSVGGVGAANGMSAAAAAAATNGYSSIASQLMLRTARGQRQYDVPQIECPTAMDGMERFACPTPDVQGRYRCIDDHVLCDGFIDCPEGEDEDRRSCMFYKTVKAHLDVLADALLRWARGR
ncbi:homeotic protein female sterile [Bactrocera neohumeralis]|uniref:homeotic protein female sterile n=1 Tax=Bactrocera neohumeralis TaxID=98809 RepID=UPI002165BF07|nr:homeotic protein female sterile [Bactrocera neohumeralis]XP_050325873.1 homeotic protein female sterile [Bactrocera neohumeralis]XP_050325874.1 homeotic protein female sterile [Bactrocera neohumeralis]XP_050325875.1 homeotic protein female sterile [Bactrocera neohumeralis]XP_050325876.1 homeotic protein female sterile [Bactrocera neohumeralis]